MEIPDPFIGQTVRTLSPFFMFWIAAGMSSFFYILIATDWIPKPDLEDPKERAFMVGLMVLAVSVFVYLLIIQIAYGGSLARWVPW